jgi:hypothetical protein
VRVLEGGRCEELQLPPSSKVALITACVITGGGGGIGGRCQAERVGGIGGRGQAERVGGIGGRGQAEWVTRVGHSLRVGHPSGS